MTQLFSALALIAFLISPSFAGAVKAEKIKREYEDQFEAWIAKVQQAADREAQVAAWDARPDPELAGKQIWREIRGSLDQSWTIAYASWLLENTPDVLGPRPSQTREPGAIRVRKAIEKFHLRSPKVAPYCLAVAALTDPMSMKVLEQIETQNPDKRVQAAAALGQAALLRKLAQGGERGIVLKRQAKLRKAVIDGVGLDIGGRRLQDLVKAEVDRLLRFSIGSTAPNLKGFDIGKKEFALSDYNDQAVVLFFWHTWMKDAERSLEVMKRLDQSLEGKKAVVIGVNADHAKTLRQMTADGRVTWRNFFDHSRKMSDRYHIDQWPYVIVLDKERKIRYKGAPGAFVDLAVEALLSE